MVGQKPFERGRGNGDPNQPLDEGGIGRCQRHADWRRISTL